mmetsp:Transcript_33145/g.50691  ORF Transcript_33145/g.50691 Transcript_33145/m.50691 type:complete len:209 (+) Transcript_33145:2125-2751(+)
MQPTSFSKSIFSTSAMVILASATRICCFIQPFKELPAFRLSTIVLLIARSIFLLASRNRFCSLFQSRCLAAATSLYVTSPITLLSSSTTGRARTSYLVNRSSTCFSVMVGRADRTGDVIKSPTVSCCVKLLSINSSTTFCKIPPASASSPKRTVADAAFACPPPPYDSKSRLRLTPFMFTPALTRPMIIMVLARLPVILSCSFRFAST